MRIGAVALIIAAATISPLLASPPIGADPKANGERCTTIGGGGTECQSGYCLPAPHRLVEGAGYGYCTAKEMNCARANRSGAEYGARIDESGATFICINPFISGKWAQFLQNNYPDNCVGNACGVVAWQVSGQFPGIRHRFRNTSPNRKIQVEGENPAQFKITIPLDPGQELESSLRDLVAPWRANYIYSGSW